MKLPTNQTGGVDFLIDKSPLLAKFCFMKMNIPLDENQVLLSVGFVYQGKLIGILSMTDFRPNHDMWWTIYTWDKHWCTKKVLSQLFDMAKKLGCIRINAMTRCDNQVAINLLKRLGFEKEGCLKNFFPVLKTDAFIFGKML